MLTPAVRVARVLSLIAAVNRHDVAAVVGHQSANVVRNRGDGSSLHGREAVAAYLRAVFTVFPDVTLTPVHILTSEPGFAVVEWVMHATHQNGRAVRAVGAEIFGFNASGEIELDEARIDTASMLTQIGGLPRRSPPAALLRKLAERYTAAWCSGEAARVADYYSFDGSLSVNGAPPAVGHHAVTALAQGFMSAFPDMTLRMDGLLIQEDRAVYRWTLEGTNTGPGGTGHAVSISGFEVWRIGDDGLIAESRGYFDSEAYQRQIEHGLAEERSKL